MTSPNGEQVKATVRFDNYRVNKGIDDKIFKTKPADTRWRRPHAGHGAHDKADPDRQ